MIKLCFIRLVVKRPKTKMKGIQLTNVICLNEPYKLNTRLFYSITVLYCKILCLN